MVETASAGQQHLRALERANEVRLARAELKRRIGDGETNVAEVVVDLPSEVQSMSISDLLKSQRRWGGARCRRLLMSIGVSENRQVGSLTDRQRKALVNALRAKARQTPPPSPARGTLSAA